MVRLAALVRRNSLMKGQLPDSAILKKTNMNIGRIGLLLVLQVFCAAPSAAQETVSAAQALLEQFDELYRSAGTAARISIKIERPKRVRTMQMRSWSQGEDKALVLIDAPARDAGTATLRVGSNLWNYLPKISRTIRVPPALMMGAWMGSDLTNDDLVRESSYAHDYEITGVGPSEEPPGWQVNTEAKPGVPGLWERIEVVFAPPKLATDGMRTEQLPVLVRYYDRKGRLARTMQLEEIKKMGERRIPTRIVIVPEREEGRRTVLTYLHVEFDVELDESLFSLAQLERRR